MLFPSTSDIIIAYLCKYVKINNAQSFYLFFVYSAYLRKYVLYDIIVSKKGGDNMSKTSSAVKNKYNSKAYDRIALTVPKGQKDIINAHASKRNETMNAFIKRAIIETMERDNMAK
jgi:hypothetical protein